MIEETSVSCPFCSREINVKFLAQFNKTTYLVSQECPGCNSSAEKIEKMLNKSMSKGGRVKTERSYMKVSMKDRK